MAWRRIGDKPLSEPMQTRYIDTYMRHWGGDELTYWDQVMHICVSKLSIIGSDNGLLPGQHQAIIHTSEPWKKT